MFGSRYPIPTTLTWLADSSGTVIQTVDASVVSLK
jgi:hypothetical protein